MRNDELDQLFGLIDEDGNNPHLYSAKDTKYIKKFIDNEIDGYVLNSTFNLNLVWIGNRQMYYYIDPYNDDYHICVASLINAKDYVFKAMPGSIHHSLDSNNRIYNKVTSQTSDSYTIMPLIFEISISKKALNNQNNNYIEVKLTMQALKDMSNITKSNSSDECYNIVNKSFEIPRRELASFLVKILRKFIKKVSDYLDSIERCVYPSNARDLLDKEQDRLNKEYGSCIQLDYKKPCWVGLSADLDDKLKPSNSDVKFYLEDLVRQTQKRTGIDFSEALKESLENTKEQNSLTESLDTIEVISNDELEGGEAILKCKCCGSKYSCNKEELKKEGELYNLGEPCTVCGWDNGYELIGCARVEKEPK